MSIPHKADKYILDQHDAKAEPVMIKVNHGGGTYTYTYINPNVYALPMTITATAGSGDIVNSEYWVGRGSAYYNAGRPGNNVIVKLNDVAILSLTGGEGSRGGYQSEDWEWRGTTRGWRKKWRRANIYQVSTTGQSGSLLITLPPQGKLEITYYHRGADYANNKGNHTISFLV